MGGCFSAAQFASDQAEAQVQEELYEIHRVYTQQYAVDPKNLIDNLLLLNLSALRRIKVTHRVELVRDRCIQNPRCSVHQILYEVCQGLYEWQLREQSNAVCVSPPPDIIYTRLPPSAILPSVPEPHEDFLLWLHELSDQLPERLATFRSIHHAHPCATTLVKPLQESTHRERFNMWQPKFIEHLFLDCNKAQELLPVRSILFQCIESQEQSSPGTLASVIGRIPVYAAFEPGYFMSELYRSVFKYQSPPGPNEFISQRMMRFMNQFLVLNQSETNKIEGLVEMILEEEKIKLDLSQLDNRQIDAVPSVDASSASSVHPWNRPSLLPGVSRRSFLNALEFIILWQCVSDIGSSWWISTCWCQEEVCWPLEILQRKRSRPLETILPPRDEEWIVDVETEHWERITSPVIDAFDECTSISHDIIIYEILPFLRASQPETM